MKKMRVVVIADPGDRDAILPLLEALKKLEIEAASLLVRGDWEGLGALALSERFQASSHILLYCSPAALASSWMVYAAGYIVGARHRAALYFPAASTVLPSFLDSFDRVSGPEALVASYAREAASWAVEEGRLSAKRELLEMGISYKEDAFAECVIAGDLVPVELFLDSGMGGDSKNKHGVTMLCLAVRSNHRGLVELLMERGADVNLPSEDRGNSPIMDAVAAGNITLVEYFIRKGARLDLLSKDGQCALVIAVGKNDAAAVKLLLAAGADPDQGDKLGFSARKYAKLFHNEAILALLADGT